MKTLRPFAPFFLLLWCWVSLPAQTSSLPYDYYSLNDGLSDRLVKTLTQADDQLIWIGTENGLNKFDGYNFTVFNNDRDNRYQLSENNIRKLWKDKYGNLVIQYENHSGFFDLLDPLTHICRKIQILPEFGITGLVRDLQVDYAGDILVLTMEADSTHLYRFDHQTNRFTPVFSLYEQRTRQGIFISLLHLYSGDYLFNDSENGLVLVSPQGVVRKRFTPADFQVAESRLIYPNRLYQLYQDRMGRVWLSLYQVPGLFNLDMGSRCFQANTQFDQSKYYASLWEDGRGNLLIAETAPLGYYPRVNHLYCYTAKGNKLDFNHLLQPGNAITTIYSQDFFRTLFMGIDTGLKIIGNNRYRIKTFLTQDLPIDKRGAIMRGITGDGRGTVYLSREVDYWYALDLKTDLLDTLVLYDEDTGLPIRFTCSIDLFLDKQRGQLWGASCYQGTKGQLHRFDLENCTVKNFQLEYQITAFEVDRRGILWLGCSRNDNDGLVASFDPASGAFTPFVTLEGLNPIQNSIPRYVMEARDGKLWVGTENGVYCIDPRTNNVERYSSDPADTGDPLSNNVCYVIFEDELGKIWLGTKKGLNILDPGTGQVRLFQKKDGLPGNTVCGILPDGDGHYWISTYNGLSFFDPQKETFRNFFQSDGLSHDEFNRFSFYRDENGRYYFGGVNGVSAFYAQDLLIDRKVPPVVLTKIVINKAGKDQPITIDNNLGKIEQLLIEPNVANFTIHFTLPEYFRAGKNQYMVKLEGLDEEWSNPSNTPSVRFSQLPARSYRLLIKGADPNGNWTESAFAINIKIRQKLIKQTWFILLLILLLGLAVFAGIKYRLEQRLKVERLRTKLASDLHDEVSGLLSGIAMQSDLVQLHTSDRELKSRIQTIADVSRKAMSKMSDVIWSIDSRKDHLGDLINRMHEHAEEVLLPLDIRYELKPDKLNGQEKIPANIRQDLYFIFKEAVNNIAKHADATHVLILLDQKNGHFEMTIKDNGTARKRQNVTHPKSGQGLSNLKMRADRLNADLKITQNGGYTVYLRMKRLY